MVSPGKLVDARVLLDDERGHPSVARLGRRIGDRKQHYHVGPQAVGHPHLLAGHGVLVALLDRPCLDRLDVGARMRLGHREGRADLARRHPGQIMVFLLLGSEGADHVGRDEVGVENPGQSHPSPREGLDYQHVGRQPQTETPVLLGNRDPEKTELLHRLDHLLGEFVGVVEIGSVRDHFPVDECPDG